MALFQRRPQVGANLPLYTTGLSRTVLIVGLGNIGKEYDGTRHNIGFEALNELADNQGFDAWITKKDLKGVVSIQTIGNTRVILLKPTTFMNLSGEAVQATAHFYKVPTTNIIAVHDELAIPFGQIRTRSGGSDAGNNGIKSISQHIGEDYGRVRVGIGAETKMDASKFVLAKFTAGEQAHMPALLKESTSILTEYIYGSELMADTRSFII